jgi:hypothetical protein
MMRRTAAISRRRRIKRSTGKPSSKQANRTRSQCAAGPFLFFFVEAAVISIKYRIFPL